MDLWCHLAGDTRPHDRGGCHTEGLSAAVNVPGPLPLGVVPLQVLDLEAHYDLDGGAYVLEYHEAVPLQQLILLLP